MTYWLGLWVDGKEIDHISTPVGMVDENTLLEMVFPEEFWDIPAPKPYDFISNEGKTKKAIRDYLERVGSHKREPFYVASDKTRSDAHLASQAEMRKLADGFANEFTKLYDNGMALQRIGKEVKAQIST
jgi:hypothetical protein